MSQPTNSQQAPDPSQEQINSLLPILKQTNPHLSNEELIELAKKILTVKLSPDESDEEESLFTLSDKETEEN